MGKGKGSVDHYVAKVAPRRVLFELEGIPREAATEAMRLASHKLSLKTKFVEKD